MPEVRFTVRWPDGTLQDGYSPSTAIRQSLAPGATYPLEEFVRRARTGLTAAGERVRERFGFACTAAAAQLAELEQAATRFADGHVTVTRLGVDRGRPAPVTVSGHHAALVVGGGQAGLTVSALLAERGVEHLVLERDRAGHAWADERWDAFCLVTPNWQCRLPGMPYAGDDPTGFMVKDEILAYLDAFRRATDPPLREGVTVLAVRRLGDRFAVETSAGTATADDVILCVGGYHRPKLPPLAARLPAGVTSLHSSQYRTPAAMPDGAVLVVGSGQSGAQIAEDLHVAGREVHLCVGSAPRVARFYRGRDCVAWLEDMGHYDMPITEHPKGLSARREPNHYVTGRDGGHDIDLRAFARDGMHLHGRLLGIADGVLTLGDDLEPNLDGADATAERIKDAIDAYIAAQVIDAPGEPRYEPVWQPGARPGTVDLAAAGITSVVWATGYSTDWSWVQVPAFDGTGYPVHERGVTSVPGLSVLGLPWLHTWGSGRFAGLTRDATFLADHVAARRAATPLAA